MGLRAVFLVLDGFCAVVDDIVLGYVVVLVAVVLDATVPTFGTR